MQVRKNKDMMVGRVQPGTSFLNRKEAGMIELMRQAELVFVKGVYATA